MDKNELINQKNYDLLFNAKKNKKLSHAYLIECGSEQYQQIYKYISKLILCKNFENNNHSDCEICYKIDHDLHPEIEIIQTETGMFKFDQLKKIQSDMSKKAIYSDSKIYVILEAEKALEKGSNSLLKFIEEPVENVYAILMTNNIYKIIKTIRSRCQIIKFKNTENLLIEFENVKYSKEDVERAFDFLMGIKLKNYIAKCNEYAKKENQEFYFNFFELMILILNIVMKKKIGIFTADYENMPSKINYLESLYSLNEIKDIIKVLNKNKTYIRNNVNILLLLDKTIIELGEKYD